VDKQELIEAICKKEGLNVETVSQDLSFAYDFIFDAIIQALSEGKSVNIPQFGTFHACEENTVCLGTQSLAKKVPVFSADFEIVVSSRQVHREAQP